MDSISRCLEVFGFGADFRKWVSISCTDLSICNSNNGLHSEFFNLRGVSVRQGDPLSHLAIVIRTNDNIRGINLGDCEIKLLQYAVDTTVLFFG